jgi:hypothetical protein
MPKYDIDNDGKLTENDIIDSSAIIELELREEKAATQQRMAWTALLSMIGFTAVLFMPFFTDSRISSIADLMGLFYISMAGIVGAYMGLAAWTSFRGGPTVPPTSRFANLIRPTTPTEEEVRGRD